MDYIYFKIKHGGIADNYDVVRAAKIVSNKRISAEDTKTIRDYAKFCAGIGEEIENPSVEDLLLYGEEVKAVRKYREDHNTTLTEAKLVVRQMEINLKTK